MELFGQTVKLRLSRQGVAVLRNLLLKKPGAKRTVQAFVLDNDGSGLWIENQRSLHQEVEVLLIKWEHIEALGFETRLAEPEQPVRIGFK